MKCDSCLLAAARTTEQPQRHPIVDTLGASIRNILKENRPIQSLIIQTEKDVMEDDLAMELILYCDNGDNNECSY